jgi:uncharacterized protein (TIGR02099 family)
VLNSSYRLLKFKAKLVSFTVLFLFALYVLIGRVFLEVLPDYQDELENLLSEQIQMPVEIVSISGRWVGFDPVFDINGLSINGVENIYIGRTRIRLAFLSSIFALAPRFKSIVVEHSEFTLFQESGDNTWKVAGIEMPENQGGAEADFSGFNSILNGVAVTLIDNTILLRHNQGKVQMLRLPAVNLRYLNDNVYASGKVLQEEGKKTLLNFSIEGQSVLSSQDISGTLYLEARSAEFFDRILKTYQWGDVAIQDIDASARLWLSFDGLSVTALQGDVQVRKINWKVHEKSLPPILNAAMGFQFLTVDNKKLLMLSGVSLNWAGNTCDSNDVKITQQLSELELQASQLNIKCMSRLASVMGLLPASLQDRLDVSLPEGLLRNVKLTIREQNDKNILIETLEVSKSGENNQQSLSVSLPIERFSFEAELDNVSINAYSGAPSVKGVDGYIYAGTKGGGVIFDSPQFELGFPDLFINSWQMKRTEGAISWLINGDDVLVSSEGLRLLQKDNSLIYGDFFLRLNPLGKEDYLSLSLGIQDVALTNASDFVPSLILGEALKTWLDESLVSGEVSEGIYVGYGSIETDSPENSFTSSLYLKSNQGELSFAEGWPNLEELNADINLQNSELNLSAERAKIKDTELLDIYVVLPETVSGLDDQLNVKAKFQAGKAEQDYWLNHSPISSDTKKIMEQLEINGNLGVGLELDILLADEVSVAYQIESLFKSVDVRHISTDLMFNNVAGVLKVSSLTGVTADDVTANFLGYKADINIATRNEPSQESTEIKIKNKIKHDVDGALNSRTVITVDSVIPVDKLLGHFEQNGIIGLSGMLNYHAELNLPNQAEMDSTLTVTSDLKGVSYDCPAPFKKAAWEASDLILSLLIGSDEMNLNVDLRSEGAPSIQSTLKFVESELTSGEVLIGEVVSKKMDINGLNLVANIEKMELQPWIEFIQENIAVSKSSESGLLHSIDLKIGGLHAFGQNFKGTQALITKPEDHWVLDLKSESIQGKINFPTEDSVLDIQLDHIFLESEQVSNNEVQNKETITKKSDAELFDPRQLPEITFSTKKLVNDKINYGAWNAHVLPNGHGTTFKGLKGNIQGTEFTGQLNWKFDDSVEGKGTHTSILTMDMKGDKVEKLTKAVGKDSLVSSERFNASISLVWPGSPPDFQLANVSGSLLLEMEDGFLNTEDAKTGALRVFGILNTESIMRRLKLDFSDLYKSGVGYDVFSVNATINSGLLSFVEPLVIDGPSSSYLINGSIDLKKETLDMDMLVNLPVIQNLPLAALILGAPQIGGAVWLVDKLLGEPLSAITTARYDITGSWEKPDVKLNSAMNASKKDRSKQKNKR